jgi:hypothetical protein
VIKCARSDEVPDEVVLSMISCIGQSWFTAERSPNEIDTVKFYRKSELIDRTCKLLESQPIVSKSEICSLLLVIYYSVVLQKINKYCIVMDQPLCRFSSGFTDTVTAG